MNPSNNNSLKPRRYKTLPRAIDKKKIMPDKTILPYIFSAPENPFLLAE